VRKGRPTPTFVVFMAHAIPDSVTEWISLSVLLALYLVVALAHAALAPLTTGPDELAHYEYLGFISENGRLPLDLDERAIASYKSDQPPLYHMIAAIPASLIDTQGPPNLKRVSDHPRRQFIERTRHAWGLYNTQDERWPYRGEILRWQIGRWVSVIFGALTVFVSYLMARHFFKGWWLLALSSAALVAFIPRFTLTGSMLNYETTLAFFAALFLWALLGFARRRLSVKPATLTPAAIASAFLIGLSAGFAIVAKLSAVILPLEIFFTFWLIARYAAVSWRVWLSWLLAAAGGVLVPVGVWYGFVLVQFNTVATDGPWVGLLRPLIAADPSDATTNRLLSFLTGGQAGFTAAIENLDSGPPWEWAAIFFRTFWTVGIEGVQPLGTSGLVIVGAVTAVAIAGLMVLLSNNPGPGNPASTGDSIPPLTPLALPPRLAVTMLALHFGLALVLPLVRYIATFSLADTAQGRHVLFLAAPAFALLMVLGLSSAAEQLITQLPIRAIQYGIRFLPAVPGIFVFVWSLAQLQTMTWAYLPLLPVTTLPERLPAIDHQLDKALSPYVTLLGYETELDMDYRLLRVDLWWRSEEVSPVDYLNQLALVDEDKHILTEWIGYPAAGRYPVRAWDAGDIIHDTLWLPVRGLDAGSYDLVMHPQPVAVQYPEETVIEPLTLGQVVIDESTLRVFESVVPFPDLGAVAGFTAFKDGQPVVDEAQPYRYRETIAVSLAPLPDSLTRRVTMVAETETKEIAEFNPVLLTETQALFVVGPDWPTADYRLRVRISDEALNERVGNSITIASVTDRWQRNFTDPQPGQPVYANFANQIELLGYDLGDNRAEPGGGVPLTLYWRGIDWMSEDYTIFAKLIKADDQQLYGGRDRLPREGYRTYYWAPGEVVTDPFGIPVENDAPDGIYYVNLGLYKIVDDQAVSLPLWQSGAPTEVTSLNIGPIKIGDTPPGLTRPRVSPQVALGQPFGKPPVLTLLGFDLTTESGQPLGESLPDAGPVNVTLYWQPEDRLPIDYTTFVHIRNDAGEIVAQKDQPPLSGAYPTSLWEPGELIADEIQIPLPDGLLPGSYQVVIGLYDINTFQRLPVPDSAASEVILTHVEKP
jgi:hypothetical protein